MHPVSLTGCKMIFRGWTVFPYVWIYVEEESHSIVLIRFDSSVPQRSQTYRPCSLLWSLGSEMYTLTHTHTHTVYSMYIRKKSSQARRVIYLPDRRLSSFFLCFLSFILIHPLSDEQNLSVHVTTVSFRWHSDFRNVLMMWRIRTPVTRTAAMFTELTHMWTQNTPIPLLLLWFKVF